MGVRLQIEFFSETLQVVEDVFEVQLVEIGELRGIAQREPIEISMRVRRAEREIAAAATHLDKIVRNDLAANDQVRDRRIHLLPNVHVTSSHTRELLL